jgi:hypothetical protein
MISVEGKRMAAGSEMPARGGRRSGTAEKEKPAFDTQSA